MEITIKKTQTKIKYLNSNDLAKILDVLTLEILCLYQYE